MVIDSRQKRFVTIMQLRQRFARDKPFRLKKSQKKQDFVWLFLFSKKAKAVQKNQLEKFRANSVFREISRCSKILKDNKYFNTDEIFRENYVFQSKCRLFKILNDKDIYSIQ